MKVTEILSKPVISLVDSKTEGIIKSIVFDKSFRRAKWLVLFDNNEHLEDKALNVLDIYSLGENAVVIKNADILNLYLSCTKTDEVCLPINNNVYTTKGKCLGQVKDLILNDKYYIEKLILTNDQEIEVKNILASGEDAVIVQTENEVVNIASFKRKKKPTAINRIKTLGSEEQEVVILNNVEQELPSLVEETRQESEISNEELIDMQPEAVEVPIKPKYKFSSSAPQTLTANFNFLIGRKMERNVYSQNKELIARKNVKVTQDIVNKAKLHCKLRELVKYSKAV